MVNSSIKYIRMYVLLGQFRDDSVLFTKVKNKLQAAAVYLGCFLPLHCKNFNVAQQSQLKANTLQATNQELQKRCAAMELSERLPF